MNRELLIFGANGALGKGIVEYFKSKEFDKMYVFDLKFSELQYENIEKVIVSDLSVEKNVESAFGKVKAGKDKLFFLYSTIGGFAGGKKLWETDAAELDKMFTLNLKVNYLISKYFGSLVKQSAGGSLCLTAAYSGIISEKNKSSYGISKAGVIHLVKELALEGKEINLSANVIAPYIIDTPENRKWMHGNDFAGWVKPVEIAKIAEFLFENFHFITGNTITITHRFEV